MVEGGGEMKKESKNKTKILMVKVKVQNLVVSLLSLLQNIKTLNMCSGNVFLLCYPVPYFWVAGFLSKTGFSVYFFQFIFIRCPVASAMVDRKGRRQKKKTKKKKNTNIF